jgi:hypothetical protein
MSEGNVAALVPDISKYMYQIRKLKGALATASSERDSARAERDTFKTQNETLARQVESSKNNKEVLELRGKLREIEFRKVFDRIAKSKGIRDDAFDAAYQLGGYRPPDGEVDEDALGAAIDEQKAKQTFLTGGKTEEKPAEKQVKPGPASGQGQVAGAGAGFQLPPDTDARWSDPAWQWNNRHKIAEAIKERNANGIV